MFESGRIGLTNITANGASTQVSVEMNRLGGIKHRQGQRSQKSGLDGIEVSEVRSGKCESSIVFGIFCMS